MGHVLSKMNRNSPMKIASASKTISKTKLNFLPNLTARVTKDNHSLLNAESDMKPINYTAIKNLENYEIQGKIIF